MKNIILTTTTIITLSMFALSFATDEIHLHEGLPMMVDTSTELSDISLKDHDITFTYQLKAIKLEDAENAKEDHHSFIEKEACNDEDIQELLNNDVHFKFIYKIDSQEVLKVKVDKVICDEINQQHRVF